MEKETSKDKAFKQAVLKIYLSLSILVGIFTAVWIARIPGESTSARFLGMSIERLILILSVLLMVGIATWFLLKANINRKWFTQWFETILSHLGNNRIFGGILLLSILGIIDSFNFVTRIPSITEPVTLAYYLRLQPVVVWVLVLCCQTLLAIHLLRHGFNPGELRLKDPGLRAFLLTSAILVAFSIIIGATGYGTSPIDEGIGWYPLGTPVLVTQVGLAWGISMGTLAIWTWLPNLKKDKSRSFLFNRLDLFLGIMLWFGAFILWTSQPLKPNWFASEPRPPNFEFYPNSDASVYDISSQNLLLGEGFRTRGSPFTLRPLYTAFLAVLHMIGGLSYEPIIWMQVAVLAMMPVFLYQITSRLHNRFSGLLAGMLLIFRETNAIKLGDTISDGHAKLLMPFLPTTFGILLILWVVIKWMQDANKGRSLILISGGLVGIIILIRPEAGVLIPVVVLTALIQMRKNISSWIGAMALMTLGLILSLGPWIWRNYQLTGTIFIDSPHYRLDLIANRYREEPLGFVPTPIPEPTAADEQLGLTTPSRTPAAAEIHEATPTPYPGEDITSRLTPQPDESILHQTRRLAADLVDFITTKPIFLADFILKHFINSQVQTVFNLPTTYPITYSAITTLGHQSLNQFWKDCCTLEGYKWDLTFWPRWDGFLQRKSFLPLGLNLFLIALGISTTWKKQRFTGLVPLFAATGYYLINAIVRNSGGRYILPVDWISYCYFAIGLTEITRWGGSFFNPHFEIALKQTEHPEIKVDRTSTSHWTIIGIGFGFLLLGSTLPILERAIPSKFADVRIESRVDDILRNHSHFIDEPEKEILTTYLENGGTGLYGRALYPRFHKGFQMGSVWYFYQDRPYKHLDFYLSSPHDTGIVLQTNQRPSRFPHATDTLVFACQEYLYADALAVVLYDEVGNPTDILWRSPLPESLSCPLPPP